MGLKQNIVVVNEYTVPLPSGGGSRGGTPGEFVTRYMARKGATEQVAPIRRLRTDDFIQRYMARESATERLDLRSPRQLKREMSKAQGNGGVAFGYGEVSLSDERLASASADVQRLFDEGHTVMKTVLSFRPEYLKEHGVLPEDFEFERPGDYRGYVDQMKLRMAIMHGLDRMGRAEYDDLRYVGVIQVDTAHVHCHLAMVDAGEGTKTADGTQKGKLSARSMSLLRRGTQAWLDEKQKVKHLSSAVGYERRNVTSYVKRWAHQQMLRESLPQFLVACLPEDRRMWRLSTNHEAMHKPNRIVRELVEEVLERPGSPMAEAMEQVHQYADYRRKDEDLDDNQWARLVQNGREKIIERGVNAVYATLRQLPEDSLRVRTPLLHAMGMDYEQIAARAQESRSGDDDLAGFSFRLRSFSARLEHHTAQREEYHEKARTWEAADEANVAVTASRALYRFYLEEEEYQARCAAKYRHFLPLPQTSDEWYARWQEVAEYGERMLSLESMRKDASLRKTKDIDEAERLGREIYGQPGGGRISQGQFEQVDERISKMRIAYARKLADLRTELSGQGYQLQVETDEETGRDVPSVETGAEYDFMKVRGLDLHRMRYDFSEDVEISNSALREYVSWARRRQQALQGAVEYLESSGQAEVVQTLPVADIKAMNDLASRLTADPKSKPMLPSKVAELVQRRELLRRSKTVRLGTGLDERVNEGLAQAMAEPITFDDTPMRPSPQISSDRELS